MRNLLFICGVLLLVFVAPPAEACQACMDYFDYQTLSWCAYCVESRCGLFGCRVEQHGSTDFCVGDEGCFEYGGHCPDEPQPVAPGDDDVRLADTWRLETVRVSSAARSTANRRNQG